MLNILKIKVVKEGDLFQIIFASGQSIWAEKVAFPIMFEITLCQQLHNHDQENSLKVILATGAAISVDGLVEGLTGRSCFRLSSDLKEEIISAIVDEMLLRFSPRQISLSLAGQTVAFLRLSLKQVSQS